MNAPISDPTISLRITHRTAWQVFRTPLLVGLLSSAGLAFALFGDGIWDGLSWLALSAPILLCLIFGLRRAPNSPSEKPRASARDGGRNMPLAERGVSATTQL
jgi:hypothetical protein